MTRTSRSALFQLYLDGEKEVKAFRKRKACLALSAIMRPACQADTIRLSPLYQKREKATWLTVPTSLQQRSLTSSIVTLPPSKAGSSPMRSLGSLNSPLYWHSSLALYACSQASNRAGGPGLVGYALWKSLTLCGAPMNPRALYQSEDTEAARLPKIMEECSV
ncbi:uncharacterized protein BDR25DRAFT_354398 [Lindgomyces ingoldianus]|uniref:Uncharacterized protein n=1 Tax=Lindgomyces ingoldianus TaxID=673940 RepID=A0ACB6QYG0_9PLEO|nr:uncharacterized protein BDR25DRAFT_354398 [Lindgomyces ingoldianus]KAF2471127.1 hypothetical protein BDR25DRAFT_354398 [Lindgomyces ingoldianus]